MGQDTEQLKTTGVVTPTLMLGEEGDAAHLEKALFVGTAGDAMTAIKSGFIAILPPGSWDIAGETLRLLGASKMVIEDRIHFAQTGQVLHDV